jgi:hypothetical protein
MQIQDRFSNDLTIHFMFDRGLLQWIKITLQNDAENEGFNQFWKQRVCSASSNSNCTPQGDLLEDM